MMFLHRHLPISGRFEPGRLERIEELLFPTTALRETLVNALCHRDYSIWGGATSVAVFDDRVEIWSAGKLPFGLRPEDLKHKHESHPRNPLITDVFYRRGLIEQWGRGTNRIVELTVRAGHPEPEFAEIAGSVVVTFRPKSGLIMPGAKPAIISGGGQVESGVEWKAESLHGKALVALGGQPLSKLQIAVAMQRKKVSGQIHELVNRLIADGFIERTIPDKPQSRLQKYRLTVKGRAWLDKSKVS